MRIKLEDHLMALFNDKIDDVYVETHTAHFSVWEAHPIKVNGEESTWDEFISMLNSHCDELTVSDGTRFVKVDKLFVAAGSLDRVKVFLDDNVPEYMDGIIRIGSVISYDENDEVVGDHQDLVDNMEFHDPTDLRKYVSKKLDIDIDKIEIVEE
ncbi:MULTISPECIES: hypothetical protein [Cohnella]|uniref:Uncharacterized protein n=1 Tax=Cohnella fermenti TaxID=2565925 RepID=A0A4V3WE10_9BACL|nr:hypothetical protein [Cohnella fermenti]THF74408.1 hypothetical protein E6C55_25540 [Cohnella fermenti]